MYNKICVFRKVKTANNLGPRDSDYHNHTEHSYFVCDRRGWCLTRCKRYGDVNMLPLNITANRSSSLQATTTSSLRSTLFKLIISIDQ